MQPAGILRFFPLLALMALPACTSHYQALTQNAPEVHDFNSALASEYLAFAESEAEQHYWAHAEHFAQKGEAALKSEDVSLETPERWSVREPDATLMMEVKNRLLPLLGEDARHIVPQKAARAQLLYDCWAVQAGRRKSSEEKCSCYDELIPLMNDIDQALSPLTEHTDGL